MKSITSEKGIFFFLISFFQLSNNRVLKAWLNGPEYDKNPVASSTSPTNLR